MPELPEVETSVRGILPHIIKQKIDNMVIRQAKLRWPIPAQLPKTVKNQYVQSVWRRGKYIIIDIQGKGMIIHLGMSGSLRIVNAADSVKKHDHFDLVFANGNILRYHDPRRFGCCLPFTGDPCGHSLLASLGVEPLTHAFNADYLYQKAQGRKGAVKNYIMSSQIVVGVGNIYASEALFYAGIHPKRQAGRISYDRYAKLVEAIKKVLNHAILQGGSTLNDFVNADGKPGYFQQTLAVYGRAGQSCPVCQTMIKVAIIGQRSSFYCPNCQH